MLAQVNLQILPNTKRKWKLLPRSFHSIGTDPDAYAKVVKPVNEITQKTNPDLFTNPGDACPSNMATNIFFNNYLYPYLLTHSERNDENPGYLGRSCWLANLIKYDFMQKNIMRAVNDATMYLKLHAAEMMRQYRHYLEFRVLRTRRRNSDSMIRHDVMEPRSSIEYHRMLRRDHPATLPGTNSRTPWVSSKVNQLKLEQTIKQQHKITKNMEEDQQNQNKNEKPRYYATDFNEIKENLSDEEKLLFERYKQMLSGIIPADSASSAPANDASSSSSAPSKQSSIPQAPPQSPEEHQPENHEADGWRKARHPRNLPEMRKTSLLHQGR